MRDRLLAGVDEVGIDLVSIGKRPHAQHAVLGMQRHFAIVGQEIGDKGRNADAEIDVVSVLQLTRGAPRHILASPAFLVISGHSAPLLRTVSFSMRFSLMVLLTTLSTKMPGV